MAKNVPRKLPSVKFLRECFTYSWRTGELRWRTRPQSHFEGVREWRQANTRCAGKLAGTVGHSNYLQIDIKDGARRRSFLVHRVIWKMAYGKEPPATIDHVDGNILNNRLINLRTATMSEQRWNSRIAKNNASGLKGVYRTRYGKWEAHINICGNKEYLGTFKTPQEAAVIHRSVARKHHGEFYREN